MFSKLFVFICSFHAGLGMIALSQGFHEIVKEWPQYVNKTKSEVKADLLEKYPHVTFKVFDVKTAERHLEEFYFGSIKIVVDKSGVVVEPPRYVGEEPDFSFAKKILNKKWTKAKKIIKKHLPSVKIVLKKSGEIIEDDRSGTKKYVLVMIDSDGIIRKIPEYIGALHGN